MHDVSNQLSTPDALRRLARARDAEAWGFLLEQHGPWLLSLARRFTRDQAFAEDIVQEVLLHVRDHAGGYHGTTEASARGWLARVACNLAIGLLRSGRRQRRRESATPERTPTMDAREQLELSEILQREIVRLPEALRRPLVLRFFAELSLSEIGAALGLTETAVKTRVGRGIERLRKQVVLAGIPVSIAMLERTLATASSTSPSPSAAQLSHWQPLLHSPLKALPESNAVSSTILKPLCAAAACTALLAGVYFARIAPKPSTTAALPIAAPTPDPAPKPPQAPHETAEPALSSIEGAQPDHSAEIQRLIEKLNSADAHIREDSEAALCRFGTTALPALHKAPPARPVARVIRKVEADQEFKLMAEQRGHRGEFALKNGGSRETEKAVDDALAWLASQQDANGQWASDQTYPVATTSLSLLALLGAGNTEDSGPYAENVRHGINWLIAHQNDSGTFQPVTTFGYEQPMAATALAEAAVLCRRPATVEAARRALNVAVTNQTRYGSWGYHPLTHSTPDPPGDLSITAWDAQLLYLARGSELNAGDDVLEQAQKYILSCQSADGGFGYSGAENPSESCTGMGGFVIRLLHGSKLDADIAASWLNWRNSELSDTSYMGIYSAYYQTNCLFQNGGAPWERWNTALKTYLLQRQNDAGAQRGAWTFKGFTALSTTGQTALSALCLEAYYRYPRLEQK